MDILWYNHGLNWREENMTAQALFHTGIEKDYLRLFNGTKPKFDRVREVLDLKYQDIAKATGFPSHAVRPDKKMPKELEEKITEWAIAISLVAKFFKDPDKTVLWFKTANPLLGNVTPRDMIRVGRFKKLEKFILSALEENQPAAA